MRLHVVYDKDGDKVGDIDSMEYALSKLNEIEGTNKELWINVANELVIHCFRVLVREGRIKPYSELFFYNKSTDPNLNRRISVDSKGEVDDYPDGFLDTFTDILCKLI